MYPSQADCGDDFDDFFSSSTPGDAEAVVLPLPSYLGLDRCQQLGLDDLANQELQLQQGQANDSLHEMQLALADKAVLYRMDVRHGRNYNMTMRAWKKVADMEAIVRRHATVYRRCRQQMVALGVGPAILNRYQILQDTDLRVSTAVSDPNARGHQYDRLAWFWTMDIPQDTDTSDWMSECMISFALC